MGYLFRDYEYTTLPQIMGKIFAGCSSNFSEAMKKDADWSGRNNRKQLLSSPSAFAAVDKGSCQIKLKG